MRVTRGARLARANIVGNDTRDRKAYRRRARRVEKQEIRRGRYDVEYRPYTERELS